MSESDVTHKLQELEVKYAILDTVMGVQQKTLTEIKNDLENRKKCRCCEELRDETIKYKERIENLERGVKTATYVMVAATIGVLVAFNLEPHYVATKIAKDVAERKAEDVAERTAEKTGRIIAEKWVKQSLEAELRIVARPVVLDMVNKEAPAIVIKKVNELADGQTLQNITQLATKAQTQVDTINKLKADLEESSSIVAAIKDFMTLEDGLPVFFKPVTFKKSLVASDIISQDLVSTSLKIVERGDLKTPFQADQKRALLQMEADKATSDIYLRSKDKQSRIRFNHDGGTLQIYDTNDKVIFPSK